MKISTYTYYVYIYINIYIYIYYIYIYVYLQVHIHVMYIYIIYIYEYKHNSNMKNAMHITCIYNDTYILYITGAYVLLLYDIYLCTYFICPISYVCILYKFS